MSAHTPLPWRDAGFIGTSGSHAIVGDDGSGVASLGGPPSHPVVLANAELIVRAVNAHDDLLAALERSASWLRAVAREYNDPRFTDRYGEGPKLQAAAEAAEEVIGRARGEASV